MPSVYTQQDQIQSLLLVTLWFMFLDVCLSVTKQDILKGMQLIHLTSRCKARTQMPFSSLCVHKVSSLAPRTSTFTRLTDVTGRRLYHRLKPLKHIQRSPTRSVYMLCLCTFTTLQRHHHCGRNQLCGCSNMAPGTQSIYALKKTKIVFSWRGECTSHLWPPHFLKVDGYKSKAALLSLYNELYDEIVRLGWRVSPEPLRLSALPHWADLTFVCHHKC